MDVFQLTRSFIDIESIAPHESAFGSFLYAHLRTLAERHAGQVERIAVEDGRFNVFACWGKPVVTMSTHMDTVPPFIPSQEDAEHIWGRGACDAKGIIAAMTTAAKQLLECGTRNFGLLFVVGEERDSAGAIAAARKSRGSRYLINGEPTENHLAIGSKGALRCEINTQGQMAHSAYPELGHSAVDDLLDCLDEVRRIPLSEDTILGRDSLNIGTIQGGRAPNVIADSARAEIMFRLVGDPSPIRTGLARAVSGRANLKEVLYTPALRLGSMNGLPMTVVSYTTDVPFLQGAWGTPFLIGPGSIHVAHTAEERISKAQLREAADIYATMVKSLVDRD